MPNYYLEHENLPSIHVFVLFPYFIIINTTIFISYFVIQFLQFIINTSIREHPIRVRLTFFLHLIANTLFPISYTIAMNPFLIQFSFLIKLLHRTYRIPFTIFLNKFQLTIVLDHFLFNFIVIQNSSGML